VLTEELKVYWQPGCSSCVKVKELLDSLDVPYRAINILSEPDELEDLMKLGVRSVPVVRRGDDYVFAQSMEDVSNFVGKHMQANRLSPETLVARWIYFLDTARRLIPTIPDDKMEHRPVEQRPRNLGELSVHIFQIPHAFVEVVENGLEDTRTIIYAKRPDLKSQGDVLGYADTVTDRLKDWARTAKVEPENRVVTYYGLQPVHHLLERSTWHSAQHVRQLGVALDSFGLKGSASIDPGAYEGLPMPKGVWE
jgi:glutaredoxin